MQMPQSEKIMLEHQAAKVFMRLYEQQFKQPMRHIWHNQPAKPDVSCYFAGERLDLEIAHLYGSEVEAMHILGRTLTEQTRLALQALANVPVKQRLFTALARLIAQKGQKKYDSRRVWLVIRNANPAWHCQELSVQHLDWSLPAEPPFEQIWLVNDMQGLQGITPLYPVALWQQVHDLQQPSNMDSPSL